MPEKMNEIDNTNEISVLVGLKQFVDTNRFKNELNY